MTTALERDEAFAGARCCAHGVDEPWAEDDFKFCYECWHVFRTEQDLVDAHNRSVREDQLYFKGTDMLVLATSADTIYSCPYCIHDF